MEQKYTIDERFLVRTTSFEFKHYLFNLKNSINIKELEKFINSKLSNIGFTSFNYLISLNNDGVNVDVVLVENIKNKTIHPISGSTKESVERWYSSYNMCLKNKNYSDFLFYSFDYLLNHDSIKKLIETDFTEIFCEDVSTYQAQLENMVLADFPYHSIKMDEIRKQQKDFFNAGFQVMWDVANYYNSKELIYNWSEKKFQNEPQKLLNKILNKEFKYS